ncbi:MAG: hypothetical protein JRN12_02905 [Nitrososphaerota archaeon]|jgi:hypothetical protein|nr:hypothetical protein [Nitrososphaerota archaeon]MDG6943058.1 hypothetical protein [Nitrososphaerota archaeon]MDG6950787.1 hypothetical protein [Nitrososphaerota archaeon]
MLWMNVAAVFAVINVVLVIALLALYFQSWRSYRSSVSVGLMTFSVFFLVQNIVIIVFWTILYGLVPSAQAIVATAAPYLTVINAMETVALANLLRITWS